MVLAGLAMVVAAGVPVLWHRSSRVTRENFSQIGMGMTKAEVDEILGPPGDYRTALGETERVNGSWYSDSDDEDRRVAWDENPEVEWPHTKWALWESDTLQVVISIDESGLVRSQYAAEQLMAQQTTSSGAPSACGTAGSRSRPCGDGSWSWRWRG